MGKDSFLNKWLKKLGRYISKNEVGPLTPGSKLLDSNLGDEFLDLTPKEKVTKAKINKWNHINLKRFCKVKKTKRRKAIE